MKQAIIDLAAAVKELAAAIKEGKEENSPTPPIRRKPKKPTTTTTRAREKFLKPTVEEVAAYIREKGYTFDADAFWNYYESKGWLIGRNAMRSWKSACATWQLRENKPAVSGSGDDAPSAAERFLMECMAENRAARKEAAE